MLISVFLLCALQVSDRVEEPLFFGTPGFFLDDVGYDHPNIAVVNQALAEKPGTRQELFAALIGDGPPTKVHLGRTGPVAARTADGLAVNLDLVAPSTIWPAVQYAWLSSFATGTGKDRELFIRALQTLLLSAYPEGSPTNPIAAEAPSDARQLATLLEKDWRRDPNALRMFLLAGPSGIQPLRERNQPRLPSSAPAEPPIGHEATSHDTSTHDTSTHDTSTHDTSAPLPINLPPVNPTMTPVHYAIYYGPEYAMDAAMAVVFFTRVFDYIPAADPAIGVRATRDDVSAVFDPRVSGIVGKPFVGEQVSELNAGIGIATAAALAFTYEGLSNQDFHRTHNLVLGAATAIFSTATITDILKVSVGRLRPDYRERLVRASCAGITTVDVPEACPEDGFVIDEKTLEDGRRSFVSGHTSMTMAAATYFSLYLGSELIWGPRVAKAGAARTISQVSGALAIGTLFGLSGYTAASRVTDNRHHLGDVVAGAGIGASIGLASYLLHFDLDGTAKKRGLRVAPMAQAPGVQVSGAF